MNNSYRLAVFTGKDNEDYSNKGKHLFKLMSSLRVNGYQEIHGNQISLKDNLDKSSTHLFLYQELNNVIEPLSCIRIIHSNYCTNDVFPPLVNLRHSKNFQAYCDTYKFIQSLKEQGLATTYDCLFTVSPKIRKEGRSPLVTKYLMSAVFNWHKENNLKSFIVSALLRLKTDKFFYKLGFKKISQDSQYILHTLNSEKTVMMKFTNNPTNFTQRLVSDYKCVWDNRVEYVGKLVTSS